MNLAVEGVWPFLLERDDFLVTSHLRPDGDALGCVVALTRALAQAGKRCIAVIDGPVPPRYRRMPEISTILAPAKAKSAQPKTAVVLDSGSLRRTGKVEDLVRKCPTMLNIDHHEDNDRFGTANRVDPAASSTGEILCAVLRAADLSLDRETAELLYVAIATDTGFFRFPNTTAKTHEAVAWILRSGFPVTQTEYLYLRSPAVTRLVELATRNLRFEDGVGWTVLRDEDFRATGARPGDMEFVHSWLQDIEGMKAFFSVTQIASGYKVSLRCTPDGDVGSVARRFGGGGHRTAAGFEVTDQKLEPQIIATQVRDALGVSR